MRGRHGSFSLRHLFRRAKSRTASRLSILRKAVVESLETRVLLSTDYSLNGTQLTTTTNGTPVITTVGSTVTLTGDSGLNHFTVQNFSGNVTINGNGGGDIVTIYAGGGGTYTVHDPSPTNGNPDTLINAPRRPLQAAVTVGESNDRRRRGHDQLRHRSAVFRFSASSSAMAIPSPSTDPPPAKPSPSADPP